MQKEVRKGDKIQVTIKLEFEGTIRNHAILIENQFIPNYALANTKGYSNSFE